MICLIYRKRINIYFSIEKIFDDLAMEMMKVTNIEKAYVPHVKLLPQNIASNLIYVAKINADVFHITGDSHYLALGLAGSKTVLTIHDCRFMHQYSGLKRKVLQLLFLTWPVKRCKVVTTISEQSKKEIIAFSGCSPDKIKVIPNPVSSIITFSEKIFDHLNPAILFIGTTDNKNLANVVEALVGIKCELHIIGIVSENLQIKLRKYKISYTTYFQITEEQLADMYRLCDMLLFPSTYEGFGLPIIEAQKAGRVVITSEMSPMKEVAGDGACFVNPFSPASIREGILKVSSDAQYRSRLIKQGCLNVENYLSANIAKQYLEVYGEVAS